MSISNFLPNKDEIPKDQILQSMQRTNSRDPLGATFYKTAPAESQPTAPDYEKLFTMKDIDQISKNIGLPSLQMTRSSSFNTVSANPNTSPGVQTKESKDPSVNPYGLPSV